MSTENIDVVLNLTKNERDLLRNSLEDSIEAYKYQLESDSIKDMPQALAIAVNESANELLAQYEALLSKVNNPEAV
jgi:hypothetical protein